MSQSLDLTSAAAFQDYVQSYDFNLLGRMFHGFASAPYLTPHANVKGRETLTEMQIGNLIKRFKKEFAPGSGTFKFVPRHLDVIAAKIDEQIYPQEYASTYLGLAQRQGFNHQENPFEGYILNKLFQKKDNEKDIAIWQGEAIGSPTDTSPLVDLMDGFLKRITDALSNNEITAVSTGALTLDDMVTQTESVYKGLGSEQRNEQVTIFMSVDNWALYAESYRENYSKNYAQKEIAGLQPIRLDGGNAWIVPMPGMGTSDRIIATTVDNMHYGFDSESDDKMMNFEKNHRAIDWYMDFKFGCQIGIMHDSVIRVNNQS